MNKLPAFLAAFLVSAAAHAACSDPANPACATPVYIAPTPAGATIAASTALLQSVTTTGTIAAGATQASFYNAGAIAVTVAGGSLPAGASVNFSAPSGKTLSAIAYTTTGSTLLISSVR